MFLWSPACPLYNTRDDQNALFHSCYLIYISDNSMKLREGRGCPQHVAEGQARGGTGDYVQNTPFPEPLQQVPVS